MHPSRLLLVLCFIAFISLGLPDALLAVAWPTMADEFSTTLDRLGIIMTGGTVGYALSSFMIGAIVNRIGLAGLLIQSASLTVIALVLFMVVPDWYWMPFVALIAGLGGGGIDAGLNAYVEKHYSSRIMQWLHASFGVGVTLGPAIMTLSLAMTGLWRPGYLLVAFLMLLMLSAFIHYRGLWSDQPSAGEPEEQGNASMLATLKLPAAWLSMLAFFLYTSAEIGLGFWAFTLLTESRGVVLATAGLWVTLYWGSFTLGRIVSGLLAPKLGEMKLTLYGLLLSLIGLVLFTLQIGGPGGVYGLALVGLGFAPTFPALLSTTSERVAKSHVTNLIGMQISAAGVGLVVMPLSLGLIVSSVGLEALAQVFLGMTASVFLLLTLIRKR
ncbi:Glucose/mannose transporter GlcP [Marinobacterium sp. xm-g-59]|uniref:MFS transporter n=1 Tax=Marinobacterium sp. xm-g-59 TaxID=2497748 RepID=UPI00156A3F1E|nr:MFS transporter [Marinobacterium sp. xm-g-59]NRP95925.1 Glucose/mannose transporter GlcP [Marinobacterium sp. xm-g-59]